MITVPKRKSHSNQTVTREDLNKTQTKLGLVNYLSNQNEYDFEERSPILNVMDLLDTDSRGLVHPVPLERHSNHHRTAKDIKSTSMSNPQSR